MKFEIEKKHVIGVTLFFTVITMVWAGAYLNEHYSTTNTQLDYRGEIETVNVPFIFSSYGIAYMITFVAIIIFLVFLLDI